MPNATATRTPDADWALAPLKPLAARLGFTGPIADFHRAVNVAFHACESRVYDNVHKCMWESLPAQYALVASDCLAHVPALASRTDLRLLDIGCGTGLSAQLLLDSPLGQRVSHVTLLDTSSEMLALAESRVSHAGRTTTTFCGELGELPTDQTFDVILICSVLHHIPDVATFLHDVARRQQPGGVFLHMHDPNYDHRESTASRERARTLRDRAPHSGLRNVAEKLGVKELAAGVRRLVRPVKLPAYMEEMNARLIADGVIRTPMARLEIFSVTDIHVGDDEGVSLTEIRGVLEPAGYGLVTARSYAFFGALQSELPADLAVREAEMIAAGQPDGTQFGAAWVKVSGAEEPGLRLVQ